jgi:hypothetical protein
MAKDLVTAKLKPNVDCIRLYKNQQVNLLFWEYVVVNDFWGNSIDIGMYSGAGHAPGSGQTPDGGWTFIYNPGPVVVTTIGVDRPYGPTPSFNGTLPPGLGFIGFGGGLQPGGDLLMGTNNPLVKLGIVGSPTTTGYFNVILEVSVGMYDGEIHPDTPSDDKPSGAVTGQDTFTDIYRKTYMSFPIMVVDPPF